MWKTFIFILFQKLCYQIPLCSNFVTRVNQFANKRKTQKQKRTTLTVKIRSYSGRKYRTQSYHCQSACKGLTRVNQLANKRKTQKRKRTTLTVKIRSYSERKYRTQSYHRPSTCKGLTRVTNWQTNTKYNAKAQQAYRESTLVPKKVHDTMGRLH